LDLSVGRRFKSGEQLAVAWVVRGQMPERADNWQNIQPFESINNDFNNKIFEPRNCGHSSQQHAYRLVQASKKH
jgi:hypothetical protein